MARATDAELKDVQIVTTGKTLDCYGSTERGDRVIVHYTGKLKDGTVFDSSRNPGRRPFGPLELGGNSVIAGWEAGLLGMCVGENRTLTIPPHLGYGDRGMGPIPPKATLIFDVELMSIVNKPKPEAKAEADADEDRDEL
ncbi:hypothetical protein CXG81DRAFT_9345 [Caulochytrium protostelioides]|uniref:peptidylprolyl isomerase n=1 Tax=Caulochytrium protostelioides TaxID=1555241 RepID=A0A4P9XDH5_9FUNG|nr:hypothetical protein CXG81DRAFT_9345 [Caulochytrium protostelioides]|eukprot:RKP03566.1 hypothetical protein CXG81DRAFT_9345 [Caulochytrium protostelioides]